MLRFRWLCNKLPPKLVTPSPPGAWVGLAGEAGIPENVFAETASQGLGQEIRSTTLTVPYETKQSKVPPRFSGVQGPHLPMARMPRTLWPSLIHHVSLAFTRDNPGKEERTEVQGTKLPISALQQALSPLAYVL